MAILENVNEIEEKAMKKRRATIERITKETRIRGSLVIDGQGTL